MNNSLVHLIDQIGLFFFLAFSFLLFRFAFSCLFFCAFLVAEVIMMWRLIFSLMFYFIFLLQIIKTISYTGLKQREKNFHTEPNLLI